MASTPAFIQENMPLAQFTTFGVGGQARYFAEVTTEEETAEALAFAGERGLPLFVLGGGSNVLISDEGFPGLVILNRIKWFSSTRDGEAVLVTAGAGEDWQDFADRCISEGWQGVECLAGVPGTVGASPVQNIGAYGQEVSQTIADVRALETGTGSRVCFTNEACGFGYRRSIFNTTEAGKYVITGVTFRLLPNGPAHIGYRELAERLSGISSPTLGHVRDAVLALRDGKGLLVREGYESFRSAGSFFKNPVVTADEYERIARAVEAAGGCSNWAWPTKTGMVKLSAACLIQSAGFIKGFRKGAVGISPRHTLIMINYGGASASELVAFASEVQRTVRDRFGVLLVSEVRLIGFNRPPLEEA